MSDPGGRVVRALTHLGLRLGKEALNRVEFMPVDEGYALEQDYSTKLMHTEDAREATRAVLEKRPPAGLWGGLWCLPEISPRADPRDYCRRRLGAGLASATRLPLVRHGFTHFTLDITPVVCRVASASPCASEPGQVWLPVEEAAQAAVPAPVRKLLNSLQAL